MDLVKKLAHHFVANPLIFDLVQRALGLAESRRHLIPYLDQMDNQSVLDVGAGTGNWTSLLPPSASYIWLDTDTQKLQGFEPSGRPVSRFLPMQVAFVSKPKVWTQHSVSL